MEKIFVGIQIKFMIVSDQLSGIIEKNNRYGANLKRSKFGIKTFDIIHKGIPSVISGVIQEEKNWYNLMYQYLE